MKLTGVVGLIVIGSVLLLMALSGAIIVQGEQLRDDYINRKKSSVVILSDIEQEVGTGTGFYVRAKSGNSFILTNGHVCGLGGKSGKLLVDKWFTAPILAIYKFHDLCLVGNPLNQSGLITAKGTRDGENIYTLGHPLGEPKTMTKGQVSGSKDIEMIVESGSCDGPNDKLIKIDNPIAQLFLGPQICVRKMSTTIVTANILPGNSGSPVVNVWGEVVGVAFASMQGSGRGYLVPLEEVKKFLEQF